MRDCLYCSLNCEVIVSIFWHTKIRLRQAEWLNDLLNNRSWRCSLYTSNLHLFLSSSRRNTLIDIEIDIYIYMIYNYICIYNYIYIYIIMCVSVNWAVGASHIWDLGRLWTTDKKISKFMILLNSLSFTILQHKSKEKSIYFHVLVAKNGYFLINREYCFLSIRNFNRAFLKLIMIFFP